MIETEEQKKKANAFFMEALELLNHDDTYCSARL